MNLHVFLSWLFIDSFIFNLHTFRIYLFLLALPFLSSFFLLEYFSIISYEILKDRDPDLFDRLLSNKTYLILPRYYVIDGALIVQSTKTRETNKGYSSLDLIIFYTNFRKRCAYGFAIILFTYTGIGVINKTFYD